MSEPTSFYVPDGPRFVATELTRGPWRDDLAHGGPPAALAARALSRLATADFFLTRISFEFVRPLVIGPLEVATSVAKGGKKMLVLLASVTLDGREIVRATATAVRRAPTPLPQLLPPVPPFVPSAPESLPLARFSFFKTAIGYHTAVEGRVARGTWGEGSMALWLRMRVPLVLGEPTSPLERVVVAADAGSGVSFALDTDRFAFPNVDLTTVLYRPLEGEWICLDSVTRLGPEGIGLADTSFVDVRGPLGRGMQSLIVEERATS